MMLRHLSKTVTAGALAVTLAVTGITASATPAAANGHRNNNGAEAAAIFGGLLLLYGLSQANRNNQVTRNAPVRPVVPQAVPHVVPQWQYQPLPQPVYRVAPARCSIEGYNGNRRVLGYRYNCMQSLATNAHLLPSHCLRNVWTDRGQRTIYGANCLANNGWTRG